MFCSTREIVWQRSFFLKQTEFFCSHFSSGVELYDKGVLQRYGVQVQTSFYLQISHASQTYYWAWGERVKAQTDKIKQTVIYHKLLSCINLFGQSAITFYCFSYLPFGCQWMLSFQKQLNYLLKKLASFSIYLLSSFVCRNECSFSIGYMQIAPLYFCFRRYNNSGAKTFQVNVSLICMKMRRSRNTFSYDWFHMKTYLNTEAKNNVQMMDIEGANLQWL